MNVLPYQSQTSCRKAFGMVSTNRGKGLLSNFYSLIPPFPTGHEGRGNTPGSTAPLLAITMWAVELLGPKTSQSLQFWVGKAVISNCSLRWERGCLPLLLALEEIRRTQADFSQVSMGRDTPFT